MLHPLLLSTLNIKLKASSAFSIFNAVKHLIVFIMTLLKKKRKIMQSLHLIPMNIEQSRVI